MHLFSTELAKLRRSKIPWPWFPVSLVLVRNSLPAWLSASTHPGASRQVGEGPFPCTLVSIDLALLRVRGPCNFSLILDGMGGGEKDAEELGLDVAWDGPKDV